MALERKYDNRNNAFSDWMRMVGRRKLRRGARSRPRQIDLDGLFYCDRCGELLFLVESFIATGSPFSSKTTSVGLALADRAKLRFYLVRVHLDPEDKTRNTILSMDIQRQYDPGRDPGPIHKNISPDEAEDWVMGIYDKHEADCAHPTGLIWDRKKRLEVPCRS